MNTKVSKALGTAAVIAITFGFSASAMADPNENSNKTLQFQKTSGECTATMASFTFGGWGPDFNPGDFAELFGAFFAEEPLCEGVAQGSGQANGNVSKPD
jgi:hypothetical protein